MNVYVQSSGSRYKFEKVGASGVYGQFMNILANYREGDADFNLYPILHNLKAYDRITSSLKRMITTDKAESFKVYLSYRESRDDIEEVFIAKLDEEILQKEHKHMFIRKAQKQGKFICLQVSLSRAGTPDMEQLNPELSYVGAYAIHRAKNIEQELWSVVGIAQVADVTKEEILRYQFT